MKSILSIGGINWVHISAPTSQQIEQLSDKYNLHELIVDDIIELNTQDKIDVYDDYIFMVFHFPKYNDMEKRYMLNEFDIILGKDFIISITRFHTNHINKIKDEYNKELLDMENEEKYKISPYYILYKILDVMFDKTLNMLNKISKDIIYLEEEIFSKNKLNKDTLENLMIKRRNIAFLKHNFLPQTELLEELQNILANFYEDIKLEKETQKAEEFKTQFDLYFEDLSYKLDKVQNHISILLENINSLTDIYNGLMSIRTNSMLGILTIFTAVIGVLTFISGIYGMNIDLPFQQNKYAFFIVLSIMILAVSTILFILKKKGWI